MDKKKLETIQKELQAVSYTHLDVYKRQTHNKAMMMTIKKRKLPNIFHLTLFFLDFFVSFKTITYPSQGHNAIAVITQAFP